MQAVLTVINNKQPQFNTAGSTLINKFIVGVKSRNSSVKSTFMNIVSGCLTSIKNRYSEFQTIGKQCITKFVNGVSSKEYSVKYAFTNIVRDSASVMRDYYYNFYNAGGYLVEGFADGINANRYLAEARARDMAAAAAEAARSELDEHSPSKVGYEIGDYFGIAFVNALGDNVSKSYKAGSEIASSAKDGLNNTIAGITDFINGSVDTQPTIRPVMDLSSIQNGTNRLYRMMSGINGYSLSGSVDMANSVATSMSNRHGVGNNDMFGDAMDKIQKSIGTLSERPIGSIDNKFYINGNNPKEIADEVSRTLQRQVERRNAAWE